MPGRLLTAALLLLALAIGAAADSVQQGSRTNLTSPTLSNPTISGTVRGTYTIGSSPRIAIGSGGATAALCGVLHVDTAVRGNVGAGEDNLMTYTLPANTLDANGSFIRVTAWGTRAAGTITLRAYFGATDISGGNAVTAAWVRYYIVVRTSATAQEALSTEFTESTTQSITRTTPAETLSGAVLFRVTGSSSTAGDNDVVQRGMIIEACKAP